MKGKQWLKCIVYAQVECSEKKEVETGDGPAPSLQGPARRLRAWKIPVPSGWPRARWTGAWAVAPSDESHPAQLPGTC